ncbi:MAG: 50S ribosomal protein L11 methyltransferase [Clostridia bacterium]|nr:50S ribosomal protein L11 methyltransferase [Clostridia bacterium]
MNWLQLSISTTTVGIEPVCAVLMEAGVTGMEIEDKEDFHNFLENNKSKWDYVDEDLLKSFDGETKVKFYVTDNACGLDMRSLVLEGLSRLKELDENKEYGELTVSSSEMKEEDWAENWKKYFKPLEVGDKILILPEWETLDTPTDRTVFTVNPGMSFGTGSHHTTQLCIKGLEKYLKPEMNVLDLGCGSGILSIIALLLGAKSAVAVDIDANAAEIAAQNAARNGINKEKYSTLAGNILTDEKLLKSISDKEYDIVLANIVADVIIGLEPIVPSLLKKGGIFITSGIINDRSDEVVKTYEKTGFKLLERLEQGDWTALIYVK